MRLSQKLTQYFTLIVFISLTFGFIIFYFAVERATTQSAIGKLENLNRSIAKKLETQSISQIQTAHPYVKITELKDSQKDLVKEVIKEREYKWNEQLLTNVNQVSVTTYPFVKSKHYEIHSQINLTIIDNEYFVGIVMVVSWILVFIIISIIFFSELITRKLYTPFFNLVKQMEQFDVREEDQHLEIIPSNIQELDQLNQLFLKTSSQSKGHYDALKEFTQNLSHELQTPIANIKGKIELMLNTDLTENQMIALSGMYDELNKVTAINRSLVLLMSLEHHQLTNDRINLTHLINNIVAEHEDLIMMNGVKVTLDLEPDVYIKLNAMLAHVVFTNLISNANRHNVENGRIEIRLNRKQFIIRNTGLEQEFTNETIFLRFKKSRHRAESIGIGLALVKKILNLYNFEILYQFHQDWHQFTIDLKK